MRVRITEEQAALLNFETNSEFVRAAFYTGHSVQYILEYGTPDVYKKERASLIRLAYDLGMNDADTVEVIQ